MPAADSRSIRRRLFEGNFYFFLAPAPEGAKARYRDNVTLSIASDGSFDPRAFDAQVAELLLPRLKADLPGYELLGHEVVPLGAGEAARIEGRFTLEGGARVRNVQLFIPRAERGRIILTGTSLEEDRAAFAAVFADIVASLDVPPPPPEPTEGAGLAGWALIAIALLLIPIAITGARRGGGDARARRRRR